MSVVAVTLAATLCIQLGYFLWKLSADRAARRPASAIAPTPWQSCRAVVADSCWLAGLAATSAGWVLFVQATALGDISLVQPLMSAGDLVLVGLAVVFLGERLGRVEWVGILTIVAGAALLAAGAGATGTATPNASALALLLGLAGLAAAGLLMRARRGASAETALAAVVGLAFGAGAVLTKALTAGHPALDAGLLADPLLAAIVAANAVGLVLLQIAFRRGRAAVIVPLQLAVACLFSVVAGSAAFGETVDAARALGVLLVVAGTAVLHGGRAPRAAPPALACSPLPGLAVDTECRPPAPAGHPPPLALDTECR